MPRPKKPTSPPRRPASGKRKSARRKTSPATTTVRRKTKPPAEQSGAGPQRLQKILAAAGLGSRRECEELIAAGRVEVDGTVADELGIKVDLSRQSIRFDGEDLSRPKLVYYAINKPPGVVSTTRDPSGRTRVIDLISDERRLFTVGRLDMASDGLMLVTNDGELANRLTHPRYEVEKTYLVQVAGRPDTSILQQLRQGVQLAEAFVKVERITFRRRHKQSSILEMVLAEGRNREIRRMLARVGHKVQRLTRIAIGPLRLGQLPVGTHRQLLANEIKALRKLAFDGAAKAPKKGRSAKTVATKPPAKRTTTRKPDATKTVATKTVARKTFTKKTIVKKADGRKPIGRKKGRLR